MRRQNHMKAQRTTRYMLCSILIEDSRARRPAKLVWRIQWDDIIYANFLPWAHYAFEVALHPFHLDSDQSKGLNDNFVMPCDHSDVVPCHVYDCQRLLKHLESSLLNITYPESALASFRMFIAIHFVRNSFQEKVPSPSDSFPNLVYT